MTFTRSFTPDSYWNTPIAANAPVDPNSAAMITEQAKHCHPPTLGNPVGGWAMPWSEATKSSKLATIRSIKTGQTVQLLIDPTVGMMAGDDAAVVFRDLVNKKVEVGTFETNLPRKRDGSVDLSKQIVCTDFSIYYTDTNGLSRQVGGDKRNSGHRGGTPSAAALHPLEMSEILRVLKTALGPPGDHPAPNFPYYGQEVPRVGGIPEGAKLRYMGQITNPVLKAAHDYGFVVGDTGSDGTATIKTVQNGEYRTPAEIASGKVLPAKAAFLKALDGTDWSEWVVMKLGAR